MGLVTRFNGVDINQTQHYVKIHAKKYLTKMLQSHGWLDDKPTHGTTPFPSDPASLTKLLHGPRPNTDIEREQLQQEFGFKYRQLMGEIMFAMVKCRPDISIHVIILSQFMDNPGPEHYKALKQVANYLAQTLDTGIHYWRTSPLLDLSNQPIPTLHQDNYQIQETRGTDSEHLIGFVDSDWATNSIKRNSMTGMLIMYAGGVIGYKSKFQTVIAHSSTEAEFVAACDTAKMILYYRSLLANIGIEQEEATILFEDNNGALMMANAQQPTKRTRHIDIKQFALLDWVQEDLLILHDISTNDNAADAMTKPLTKQLFYHHFDTYMGYRIPDYYKRSNIGINNPVHSSTTPKGIV
jgi:hypothetical protein